MGDGGKKSPFSNVGPGNDCLTSFEEPECSDTELIACMEVVEKIEEEKKAARFATLNSDELTAIVTNSEVKGTKQNTNWCVKIFESD